MRAVLEGGVKTWVEWGSFLPQRQILERDSAVSPAMSHLPTASTTAAGAGKGERLWPEGRAEWHTQHPWSVAMSSKLGKDFRGPETRDQLTLERELEARERQSDQRRQVWLWKHKGVSETFDPISRPYMGLCPKPRKKKAVSVVLSDPLPWRMEYTFLLSTNTSLPMTQSFSHLTKLCLFHSDIHQFPLDKKICCIFFFVSCSATFSNYTHCLLPPFPNCCWGSLLRSTRKHASLPLHGSFSNACRHFFYPP